MTRSTHGTFLSLLTIATLASCATNAQTGAAVGAGGGAVVGGVIGKVAGSTAKGAIIGAVVGGTAGALIGARMDRQAQELKQNIPGATVERVGEGIQVTFASGLLYDFDSDAVKAEAQSNLRALAGSLDKYPDTDLVIIGHTDQVGSSAYNQGLSERRSAAAARSIPPTRPPAPGGPPPPPSAGATPAPRGKRCTRSSATAIARRW